jgi:hypothetical protein
MKTCIPHVLRIGLFFWFAACAAKSPSTARADEFIYDFRGKPYDSNCFRQTGSNHHKVVQTDAFGLRIRLPADHVNSQPVGLATAFGVQGDFEITMDFELLNVSTPGSGSGAGVSIYITMVSPTKEAATLGRFVRPNGEQVFVAHRATTPVDGKRQHSGETAAAEAQSGRLRLVRSGTTLSFLFAEGNSDVFREFHSSEMGAADLEMVRLAADNGGSQTEVDVRIKSLTIKANDLGEARQLAPPRRNRWRWWIGGVAVLAILVGAYWRWSRKRPAS